MALRATPPVGLPTVVTVQDVADALGVHPQTVYRHARSGELPMHKIGGRWFMRRLDFRLLLEDDGDTPAERDA